MPFDPKYSWTLLWKFKEELVFLSVVLGLLAYGKQILGWIWGLLRRLVWSAVRYTPQIPSKSFAAVAAQNRSLWDEEEIDGRPCMRVHACTLVTGLISQNVHIARAELRLSSSPMFWLRRFRVKSIELGHVGIYDKHLTRHIRAILPNMTSEVTCNFVIEPMICKPETNLTATLVLTDQFGNEHKVKNIVFTNRV